MRTTLKQTLAGAWMLLAALALSTAGCSQLEDTPDATNVATGSEPISISIAPKPSFEAGDADTRSADAEADTRNADADADTRSAEAATRSADADADTRSTVAPDGKFAWTVGDRVYVILTFDDLATTVKEQLWVKADNATAGTPATGWNVYNGWNADPATATALTDQTWPVGASKCKVQAFHTNCGHTVAADGDGLTGFTYADGQGDHMTFTSTFNVGDELAIVFEHQTARITFTGLKPGTEYRLKKDGFDLYVYNSFIKSTFRYGGDNARKPFTTDDNGTFTRCMPLTDATTASVELTIYASDGTSISKGTLKAQGSAGNWKTNGYRYTMKVSDFAGEINPGNRPDLLPPAPILSTEKVYVVNGYYVTNPYYGDYSWGFVTIDANNPCKKAGNGWRIPTMKDFETMAGWGTSNPWSSTNVQMTEVAIGTDATAFHNAFPKNYYYWSSEEKDATNAWALYVKPSSNMAAYQTSPKGETIQLRCVQPFDPNKQP